MLVFAPGGHGCSEPLRVPGVMVRQGAAPQDEPSRFQGGDMWWGCSHGHRVWAVGAAGRRELIPHPTERA